MALVQQTLWVEKYRPSRLEDVANQRDVIEGIKNLMKNPKEMPHLLFAGPPGTGKTTVALIIARTILGERWRDYTLELNASDERRIETVRNRIKTFARYGAGPGDIPFRIIILDEADEMTNDAQTALRRIMEASSATTRFILTCNYSSGIIEPIQSRTTIFRFQRLSEADVTDYLERICRAEKLEYEREALSLIFQLAGGDLRHAINMLQAAASIGPVVKSTVERVGQLGPRGKVRSVVQAALEGRFREARQSAFELMRVDGLSERDFLRMAYDEAVNLVGDRGEVASLFAEYDFRLVQGAHPDIQISALLAELSAFGKSLKPSAG